MDDHADAADARGLIHRVDAEADREAAQIVADARQRAQEIVTAARGQALGRVRAEIAELRRVGARERSRMAAAIDTERRQLTQARHAAAMQGGLALLDGALTELWGTAEARAIWCANLFEEAKARLIPGRWELRYPPGWPVTERDALLGEIAAHTGEDVESTETSTFGAGLIICADSACVDGTPAALTRDPARLGALFLREMAAMQEGGGT